MSEFYKCPTKICITRTSFKSPIEAIADKHNLLRGSDVIDGNLGHNVHDGYWYRVTLRCNRRNIGNNTFGVCLLASLAGKVPDETLQKFQTNCQATNP